MDRPQFVDEAIVQEPSGVFTGRLGPLPLSQHTNPFSLVMARGFNSLHSRVLLGLLVVHKQYLHSHFLNK